MESCVVCPGCEGSKVTEMVFVSYAPDYDGPPVRDVPCVVCDGIGNISAERMRLIELGESYRRFRVDVVKYGLREASEKWGVSVLELSLIEQGKSKTTWTPPGWSQQ